MSEAAGTYCPTCNGANPLGAKFCSACRAALTAAAPPPAASPMPVAPPPPPPPRPGIGGMMGQMGGKAVVRQINADAPAVFAEIARYLRALPGTEVQHEVPPQQLSAKVAYKNLVATGGIVIAVDTTITVAPTGPGQSQVSVTTKTDMSSTNKVWIYNLFFAFLGLFIIPVFLMWALIVGIAIVMSFWLMSTSPGQNVSNALFAELNRSAATLPSVAPPSMPTAVTPVAQAPAASSLKAPAASPFKEPAASSFKEPAASSFKEPAAAGNGIAASAEEEVFSRIKKLADLRDAGAISEADFDAKKTDLLARI